MCVGVGLFGTFAGFFAAWFLSGDASQSEKELLQIRTELVEIRKLLEQRNGFHERPTPETDEGQPMAIEEIFQTKE
jgi:hypothetical protein